MIRCSACLLSFAPVIAELGQACVETGEAIERFGIEADKAISGDDRYLLRQIEARSNDTQLLGQIEARRQNREAKS